MGILVMGVTNRTYRRGDRALNDRGFPPNGGMPMVADEPPIPVEAPMPGRKPMIDFYSITFIWSLLNHLYQWCRRNVL